MQPTWPVASAWHARFWRQHPCLTLSALLASGAMVSRTCEVRAEEGVGRTYETVVVAPPTITESPLEDRAAAASVVTRDRTPRAAESVTQILSEQAGASVTRLGGMGSTATVSLRGSAANQVLVYVDGVPLNTATGGGVDLGAIPVGDVARIEIYRGTSPIAFGASAIGGVVSITTDVPKENRVDLQAGGGSFGTAFGDARAAWNRGRWHLYSGAHVVKSEGDFPFTNTKATNLVPTDDVIVRRRNNDLLQVDGTLRAVVDLTEERRLSLTASLFDRDQGLPGYALLANPHARLATLRVTSILAYEARHDHGALGRVRASAYATYNRTRFDDPDGQIAGAPADARDRTATAGLTFALHRHIRPWLLLSGALDGRYDNFRPSDALVSGAPATRFFGAAGLESDLWFERLRFDVIASLRIEAAREATSGRNNFNVLVPTSPPVNHLLPIARLALVKELAPWLSLRTNAGRYARMPSTVELYGNTGYILGDPTLKPESGTNADLGPVFTWCRDFWNLAWSTAGFASWVDDLIQYQISGMRARPRNIGKARILGVESTATLTIGPHLRMVASGTLTDARDRSEVVSSYDHQLPLRPRYRFYARPEWRAIQLGQHVTLGLYGEADITAGNYRDAPNMQRLGTRVLLGAGVYADLPVGLRLQLSARNLLDSPISDLSGYPLPGREIYLTLSFRAANDKTKEP